MALSDLNFSSGFSQGMNQGMSLLRAIDDKAAREKQAARADEAHKWRQEDRQYTVDTLRPFEEEKRQRLRDDWDYQDGERDYQRKRRPIVDSQQDARHDLQMRQGRQGLEQSADRHEWAGEKQDHWRDRQPVLDRQHDETWQQNYDHRDAQELRSQENHTFQVEKQDHWRERQPTLDKQHDQTFKHNRAVSQFKFDHLKSESARAEAQYMREQQNLITQQSVRYFQAAQSAVKDGDDETAEYYLDLAEQGMPISSYLDGSMEKALQVAKGIDTGKLDANDPAVLQQLSPLMENAMRASGRLKKGYKFAGLVQGKTGYIPVLATPKGKLVPATQGGTGEADDEVIELSRKQLRQAAQAQGVLSQQIKQSFGDVGHQYVNKPTHARLLNPNASGEDRQVQYSNGVIKQGGTRSWRNNNAGNLEYRPWQKEYGAIGSDGRFAIFATPAAGERARAALLKRDYGKFSIKGMVAKYAPKHENDTGKYTRVISEAAGVSSDTKINKLSPDQFLRLTQAMRKHEGWKAGKVIQNASTGSQPIAPQSKAEKPKTTKERLKQQRYRLQGLGGLSDKPTKQKAPIKLGKDDRLYDPNKGKVLIEAASAQNKTSLAEKHQLFIESPDEYIAQKITESFPQASEKQFSQLMNKVREAEPESIADVNAAIRDDLIARKAKEMSQRLMTSKDTMSQMARDAGLNQAETEALLIDVLDVVGMNNPEKLAMRLEKELKIKLTRKEEDQAREEKYESARALEQAGGLESWRESLK